LVFEAETDEEDIMRRKPRAPAEPLFATGQMERTAGRSCIQPCWYDFRDRSPTRHVDDKVRALTFFSLVLSIVSLVLVNRSFSKSLVVAFRRPNPALRWILLGATAVLGLSLVWPAVSAYSGLARCPPMI
jgi:P-type Ca2+ transporter type 2C